MDASLLFYEHFFTENLTNPVKTLETLSAQFSEVGQQLKILESLGAEKEQTSETVSRILLHTPLHLLHRILIESGDTLLAKVISIDPKKVIVGQIHWEQIVLDWWSDYVSVLNFRQLIPVMVHEKVIHAEEANWIKRELPDNHSRVGFALCLYAERATDLEPLKRILYHIGITEPAVMKLAQACLPPNMDDFEWIQWHRDLFILQPPNVDLIAEHFHTRGVLTDLDMARLTKAKRCSNEAELLINTLQRRPGSVMESMIELLRRDGNLDLATILSFRPSQISIPWHAFQLLQLNWATVVRTVRYEDLIVYLTTANFLPYKLHLKIKNLANNEDRIRHVLRLAIQSEELYNAVFHCLGLQPKYEKIFEECTPMSFDEQRSILEVQDYLAQYMKNINEISAELVRVGLFTPSDLDVLNGMNTSLKRNLTICDVVKTKSMGSVRKLITVLARTHNPDCSELLSVDFQNFHLSLEEWVKLKLNWGQIIHSVRWADVRPTLEALEIIKEREVRWIEHSGSNRQRMRKLLRILPTKSNGFSSLRLAMSQFEDLVPLLLRCQPMDFWHLKSIQDNMEFLVENTFDLPSLLAGLEARGVISKAERELILTYTRPQSYYEDPKQELYIILLGKGNDTLGKLVEALEESGHMDAAAVLGVDLASIKMTTSEWQDYQRMWLDFIEELRYGEIREHLLSLGLLTEFEDQRILDEPDNCGQMRRLLQILPYRFRAFPTLVQMML